MKNANGWVPPNEEIDGDDGLGDADTVDGVDGNAGIIGLNASRGRRRGHRRSGRLIALLLVVAVIAAAAGGFMWRRSRTGGSALNCSHQGDSVNAKDYCYGGFTPLTPSGAKLSAAQASPYFSKAVADTYTTDDAVRLAAAAGNTKAVNAAATQARDAATHAAETLAARTWPNDLTKAIRMVIVEYQARATIYENLMKNSNSEAIDYMAFDQFKSSGAQSVVRTALKLDPEPEPALPIAITAVKDVDDCTIYTDPDGDGKPTELARRCVEFTVTNRTASTISIIALRLNLLSADGTIRQTDISAMSDSLAPDSIRSASIPPKASVAVRAKLDPKLIRHGDRVAVTQWSIHDKKDKIHADDIPAAQASTIAVVNDFRFR